MQGGQLARVDIEAMFVPSAGSVRMGVRSRLFRIRRSSRTRSDITGNHVTLLREARLWE
jgi:hypothetical protein